MKPLLNTPPMHDYPIVPGRGLVTRQATKMRTDYLEQMGVPLKEIQVYSLLHSDIRNKIESFIGTVEIPLGLAGPLLFTGNDKQELVYAAAGTLEGALIASMNRGAKAISLSGGFNARFVHQKMVRAPMFRFKEEADAVAFTAWLAGRFDLVKKETKKYSNHAQLQVIDPVITGSAVHARFVYSTGDASGQNMTTTCTWHAMLWIVQHFEAETGITIADHVIEGNASSDKKVSQYSMEHGRGVQVIAECYLKEKEINSVLRTTSQKMMDAYTPSAAVAELDGMMGYNINVANAVAAIFVATGQDLASIHESSLARFTVKKTEEGLHVMLQLTSLVIGTVGGGTSLPRQKEALELMGCYGSGKLQRFAQLIAGFALSLEVSTYAAIVSGQFAKAHEKLGRNKPADWLLPSEINLPFIRDCIQPYVNGDVLTGVLFEDENLVENGIITQLTGRVNKKLAGFVPLTLQFLTAGNNAFNKKILIKSKALDMDVIKGLHIMAAAIDPELADLIFRYSPQLEYKDCHKKELCIYELLHSARPSITPVLYGKYCNNSREAWLLLLELLDEKEMHLFNSENSPQLWDEAAVNSLLEAIASVHHFFALAGNRQQLADIPVFEARNALPLYRKLVELIARENEDAATAAICRQLFIYLDELATPASALGLPLHVIHNDFNPRNAGIRSNGRPVIYDWELAVVNLPHRDVVELLSFVLPEDFEATQFINYLHFHHAAAAPGISWAVWKTGYSYALKEYLVTRVSFYKVAEIVMNLKFSNRILHNAYRMVQLLEATP